MKKIIVIKRDGSSEVFKKEKIVKACIAAGADKKTAKQIADKASKKVYNKITSLAVRDLVLSLLRQKNQKWAENWLKYEKEKGKSP
ncbi:MAG: ATP cone domain-containing protein [Candidatus Parvarchaeota archaeon]|nr:ATP cone domain-containing protein [Candidatus Jingweiarchaeum tengchongense]MCW1298053.1 ATP cone domain-containing protein [Candidatus Jingweiarchaeum tengchongense]MCW1300147.1 ATP cone domain-containing protein [Candidatus Jingweiarchaeum tengchongense]MCW1304357.1 ATP cone domain-containing protein [Candidatus Jingweiarchaeum tengchongense]MCW1309842.1 ATP cone domain-containing protein [Candidatus Jingweiarchaeum tengchongense]